MGSEMFVVTKERVFLSADNVAVDANQDSGECVAMPIPPIEFVTENGFCILRRADLQPGIVDSVSECHFLVRSPHGEETETVVGFNEKVIAQVQRQRHNALSDTSRYWLTLAEQHLATYVWTNNHSPVGGGLAISQVSGPDLALAAGWMD